MNRGRWDARWVLGLVLLGGLVAVAGFAPWLAPHDPFAIHDAYVMAPPGTDGFPLGTDTLGRDVLSRMIYGARISLGVAAAVVTLSMSIGSGLGIVAGYWGGWWDHAIMRLTDVFLSFPVLFMAVAWVALWGSGPGPIIAVLTLFSWMDYARVVRGEILTLREREFVLAGRAVGLRDIQLLFRYLLPQVVPSLIILGTFGAAAAILSEATLSFLGLGIPAPAPSWGGIMADGRTFLRLAPHLMLYPGLIIMVTIVSLHVLGDYLQDALDPRRATIRRYDETS